MSAVAHEEKKELDEGLEWIKLRTELDSMRAQAHSRQRPAYKYNWYMPIGISLTGFLYFYGLYHMNDIQKSSKAAYCRVTAQFLCASVFLYGFLKHHNREIKLYKDEQKRRRQIENATKSQESQLVI